VDDYLLLLSGKIDAVTGKLNEVQLELRSFIVLQEQKMKKVELDLRSFGQTAKRVDRLMWLGRIACGAAGALLMALFTHTDKVLAFVKGL
jgi:hypothetical protein